MKLASVARSRTDWLLERRLGRTTKADVWMWDKRGRETEEGWGGGEDVSRGREEVCYSWRFTNLEMRKRLDFNLPFQRYVSRASN